MSRISAEYNKAYIFVISLRTFGIKTNNGDRNLYYDVDDDNDDHAAAAAADNDDGNYMTTKMMTATIKYNRQTNLLRKLGHLNVCS